MTADRDRGGVCGGECTRSKHRPRGFSELEPERGNGVATD
jgi:hypothetical protein